MLGGNKNYEKRGKAAQSKGVGCTGRTRVGRILSRMARVD